MNGPWFAHFIILIVAGAVRVCNLHKHPPRVCNYICLKSVDWLFNINWHKQSWFTTNWQFPYCPDLFRNWIKDNIDVEFLGHKRRERVELE